MKLYCCRRDCEGQIREGRVRSHLQTIETETNGRRVLARSVQYSHMRHFCEIQVDYFLKYEMADYAHFHEKFIL